LEKANDRVTFWVLVLGVTAYSLLQSLVIPALSTIRTDLHTSQNTVTWVVTAYLLSASIFTPIMGRIGDVVGKERMLVVTLLGLTVGSVIAALAHSILLLIVGRVVQGVGGGLLPLSFGIIRDEFPPKRVASAIGVIAAMTAVGGGVGLVVAGPIITHLDYHWLFWIPLVLTSTAAICAHFFVPESPVRSTGSISWSAAALLSAWLVTGLLGISEAPVWGWGSSGTLALFAATVILVVAWITVESKVREPLIDMRMMRVRAVWTNNLVGFLFGMGMYSVMAFLPQLLQTPRSSGYGFGASVAGSGLYLLPMTAMMFLLGLAAGRIAARVGSKMALVIGASVSCAGYFTLTFAHSESWQIYLVSALLGTGLGLSFSAMSNLIVHAVPPAQTGVASGMNANIRTIGGAVGAAVMGSIVTSQSLTHPEMGYRYGFLFIAIMAALATGAAAIIPSSTSHMEPDEHHIAHAELAVVPGGTITEG
jgi:EmrB/QacA subfamily drug resistance transporter